MLSLKQCPDTFHRAVFVDCGRFLKLISLEWGALGGGRGPRIRTESERPLPRADLHAPLPARGAWMPLRSRAGLSADQLLPGNFSLTREITVSLHPSENEGPL